MPEPIAKRSLRTAVTLRALLVATTPLALGGTLIMTAANGALAAVPAQAAPKKPARAAAAKPPASSEEQVIVTGTRSLGTKARNSTSPIDVITAGTLRRTGQANLADALVRSNPSVNQKAYGNDTAALVSAIRLRGLNPNDVLVLVDGKRRHQTSNITADSGPEQGATPVDLNAIPTGAIDHIEILRDGAAAQYGSDAIAGVVNIILKKTDHGDNATAYTGANAYNGDGWQYQLDNDGGISFGQDGYLHLSGQIYHADHSVQPEIDTRTGKDDNHVLSTPEETRESLALTFGSTLLPNLFGGVEGYGNVTYMHRHTEAYENYRLPTSLPALYPWGYSPLETNEENDFASTIGVRAPDLAGFRVDLSTTYGQDETAIGTKNSANTGLYKKNGWSQTTFDAQTQTTAQWTNDLDFSRAYSLGGARMNTAFGAAERVDVYELGAGDYGSYALGGAQGFAGLLPANAGRWTRDVWSAYLDQDIHPVKQWDIDVAGRFEHYTDFGNTYNGKISSRYDFTPHFAVRGTISTGTRAPTLAEEHYSSLNVSANGASGILASNSAAARGIGAQSLNPEYSTNASGGLVWTPVKNLTLTTDVYQINIRDRIAAAGSVRGSAALAAIAATGATLPGGLVPANVSADFLANAASTRTQGLDFNANYFSDFRNRGWGTVTWTAGLDLNRTRITHINTNQQGGLFINPQEVAYLTTATPRSKLILNAFWKIGTFDVNLRQTRYGQTTSLLTYEDQAPKALQYSNTQWNEFKNTPRWLTDLEVGDQLNARWHVAVGANNIFNIRPRREPLENAYLGAQYYAASSAQVPITGGFYYGRVNLTF